jgi:hypothetical protein
VEVKNHPEYLSIGAALAQAKANGYRGATPLLICKPKGVGANNVPNWWAITYLRNFVVLARETALELAVMDLLHNLHYPPADVNESLRALRRVKELVGYGAEEAQGDTGATTADSLCE